MKKKEGIMPNLKFRKGQNAILLGNGINNVTHSHSWKDLLKHLDHKIRLEDKSYPMAFEEIILKKTTNSEQGYDSTLKEIKVYISQYCEEIDHNKFHSKIPSIDVKTILTTNYDYAIERAFDSRFSIDKSKVNTDVKRDYKYSLHRYNKVKKTKIWHIHGELDNGKSTENEQQYSSASIMIGHEHYGDYYRRIHQYLRPFSTDKLSIEKSNQRECWVDFFFTHNVHIAGLSLQSDEFHLWWILAHRARLMKKLNVKNKIVYHCASYDIKTPEQRSIIELLTAYGVIIERIDIQDDAGRKYEKYWESFFKSINSKIKIFQ
jgi:hypothetical protein